MSTNSYPALPEPTWHDCKPFDGAHYAFYTADQMRAYADATEALRHPSDREIYESISARYHAREQARATQAGVSDVRIDYSVLHEYAITNKVSFNELCSVVRGAIQAQEAAPAAQGEPSDKEALQWIIEDPARAARLFQLWINDRDATRDELKGEILRRAAQQKG